jgi:hypothetical protein
VLLVILWALEVTICKLSIEMVNNQVLAGQHDIDSIRTLDTTKPSAVLIK